MEAEVEGGGARKIVAANLWACGISSFE